MSLSVWKRVGNNEWKQNVAGGRTFDTNPAHPGTKGSTWQQTATAWPDFTRERSLPQPLRRRLATGGYQLPGSNDQLLDCRFPAPQDRRCRRESRREPNRSVFEEPSLRRLRRPRDSSSHPRTTGGEAWPDIAYSRSPAGSRGLPLEPPRLAP